MITMGREEHIAATVARLLIENHIVQINVKDLFQFVSGILSPIYIDNRQLISYTEARKAIVDFFVEKIKQDVPQPNCVIAGVATGGIPWAAWIANELRIPMVYIRSTPKDRGNKRQVEGILNPDQEAILVEDTVSTGTSTTNAVDAIRALDARINKCVAIFTFGAQAASDRFQKYNLDFSPLTDLSYLLLAGEQMGYLNATQISSIKHWASKSFSL